LVTSTTPPGGSPSRSVSGTVSGYSATVLPCPSSTTSRAGLGSAAATQLSLTATTLACQPGSSTLKITSGWSGSLGSDRCTVSRARSPAQCSTTASRPPDPLPGLTAIEPCTQSGRGWVAGWAGVGSRP